MKVKDIAREIFIFLHIDLTQNLKYDRLTKVIIKQGLKPDSNCIDIGCHKGEILDMMLKHAPKGKHIGFEPIPYLYERLSERYEGRATIYPFALSDKPEERTTTFNLVKNAPAYSGIKKRHYDFDNPEIEEIEVGLRTLDELIGNEHIDFIKIDVEGAEFGVLKGGKKLLQASTRPADIFNYINQEIGLRIFTLDAFIKGRNPLNVTEFTDCFEQSKEYYYVAAK